MQGILLHDRYQLTRVLGSGGFGQTFVAEDTHSGQSDRRCVVKQLKPLSQDVTFLEVARRLFFQEVEMLRKLGSHDRIPTLLNDFEQDGQFYLVQEYVEGRSLSEELQIYHKLDEAQVVELLRDVAEVLEFVHRENVIHRDIKPSNLIRRQQDGKLVIIDFGAVKELHTQIPTDMEPSKLTVGIATQGYAPTEQLAGKPRFNSDLYALGMTAIQALTGLHPSQLPSHPVTGEAVWQDRAEVSGWLEAILTELVRYHFHDRLQSATDLLTALDQTAIVQPPQRRPAWNEETLIPPTLVKPTVTDHQEPTATVPAPPLKPTRKVIVPLLIGLASLIATGAATSVRYLGWLQPLELLAYDRMVQLSPPVAPDPRILVVGITEADIQAQKRFPLSDAVVATTIQRLQTYKPKAIGLDLFRDIPQVPGREQLLDALKAPNTIVITNLGTPITPAPPGVPPERVGFNDVPLDADGVVRRNLIFADLPDFSDSFQSFAFRLATLYLAKQGIPLKPSASDPNIAQLGQATLVPLNPDSGGYHNLDDRGYQIMLQYRGRDTIQQVSLSDVLNGNLKPEQVKDRIILIGTTAANAKDLFPTPYSPLETNTPQMSGVLIHAHMVSQLLSLAKGEKTLLWYWTPAIEIVWIASWATLAAVITWRLLRRSLLRLLSQGLLLVSLLGVSYSLFLLSGWVTIVAPAIAILLVGSSLSLYPSTTAKRISDLPANE